MPMDRISPVAQKWPFSGQYPDIDIVFFDTAEKRG